MTHKTPFTSPHAQLDHSHCRPLPNVRPFYAVKARSHPTSLRAMAALGSGFDCAPVGLRSNRSWPSEYLLTESSSPFHVNRSPTLNTLRV
ncbi:hypothetical protein L484_011647 [Morus notabilis]|uniref:Orn/DAP/Arg decarboxylase 2 N-terminal domain-containing protein n=1 Tax=Morus notabilis TaxID=981085 RepID=W9S412_9ROSA|nr:hypothetical protein L484_011647 [Morus notabilis]